MATLTMRKVKRMSSWEVSRQELRSRGLAVAGGLISRFSRKKQRHGSAGRRSVSVAGASLRSGRLTQDNLAIILSQAALTRSAAWPMFTAIMAEP